jgi:MFS family permease
MYCYRLTIKTQLIDVWGRKEGLVLCVILMTLGSILTASTNSVQMYAAAEVFSQTG